MHQLLLLLAMLLTAGRPARAQQPADQAALDSTEPWEAAPHELRNTGPLFLTGEVLGSVALGFVVPDLVLGPQPEVLDCSIAWCGTNGFDLAINKALLAPDPWAAAIASHIFTLGLTPGVGLAGVIVPAALAGKGGHGVQDTVIVLDAFLISTGFNRMAKVGARRQRPAFHFGRQDDTEAAEYADEEYLSFYSGDTTWAFALASSASTLSFLRGYRSAPYLALATGSLALTGGILRMSADMHWATDVLVGAAAGTAVGVALPLALHGRKREGRMAMLPSLTPAGPGLVLVGRW